MMISPLQQIFDDPQTQKSMLDKSVETVIDQTEKKWTETLLGRTYIEEKVTYQRQQSV